jgi:hypothetical protein
VHNSAAQIGVFASSRIRDIAAFRKLAATFFEPGGHRTVYDFHDMAVSNPDSFKAINASDEVLYRQIQELKLV